MLCRRCDGSVQLALFRRRTGAFDPFPEIEAGPLGVMRGYTATGFGLRALTDGHPVVGQRTSELSAQMSGMGVSSGSHVGQLS